MSWQQYVDGSLVGSGNIKKGAVMGLDGTIWAVSPDLKLSPEECKAIVGGYASPDTLRANGLYIGGEKYFLLRADERTLNGKLGQTGVFCVKTNKCVLVGTYGEDTQPGTASLTVEKVADHLINSGY